MTSEWCGCDVDWMKSVSGDVIPRSAPFHSTWWPAADTGIQPSATLAVRNIIFTVVRCRHFVVGDSVKLARMVERGEPSDCPQMKYKLPFRWSAGQPGQRLLADHLSLTLSPFLCSMANVHNVLSRHARLQMTEANYKSDNVRRI